MTASGKSTHPTEVWAGQFGRDYTDRNLRSPDEIDELYLNRFGAPPQALNEEFLGRLDREARILEAGSNVGSQLVILQQMGFRNLYGIELQRYAVELAKQRTAEIDIIQGNIFDIPFKDEHFDLVFTSGVLIHISPNDLRAAVQEIHRCTRRYIWGFEYFSSEPQQVIYHGHSNLLWKRNFAQFFRDRFSDLKLLKERRVKYKQQDAVSQMYLLEKV